MVSMRKIAAETGVSIATVSRAMKNDPRVSEATRNKIMKAVKALSLREITEVKKKTKRVSLLANVMDNRYYFGVLAELERAAASRGFDLTATFYNLRRQGNGVAAEERMAEIFARELQSEPAAVLCVRNELTPPVVQMLQAQGIPSIQLFRKYTDQLHSVVYDDEDGAYKAIHFLLANSHRKIMTVGNEFIRQGGLRAYAEAGIDSSTFQHLHFGMATADIIANTICSQKITAIYSHTEECSLAALQACQQLQLRVPQDISILAYDDYPWLRLKGISIIQQPVHELAETCFSLIDSHLKGTLDLSQPHHIHLDGSLIFRNSIAMPPSTKE